MSIWKIVGGIAGGVGGFFVGGPMGAAAGASLGYGLGASADASNAQDDAAHNQFNAQYTRVGPNAGIGQGSFGLTDAERQRYAAQDQQRGQYQQQLSGLDAQIQAYQQSHPIGPQETNTEAPDAKGGGFSRMAGGAAGHLGYNADPAYDKLLQQRAQIASQIGGLQGPDMSDPGRFAAMSDSAQGRQGQTLNRYGVGKTAAPDMVDMQQTAAPDIYNMQRQNAPGQVDMQKFNAQQFDIDPNAGNREQQNQEAVRQKNLEVMGAVQDRAMGRGGPSVAELQMKQGQDRAISGQAALAASGGQMDYAQARRQAMLGAADIQQKTASDTGILRANEQIAAQNTFGGLSSAQQNTDLSARGQTMNQANSRAQFLSGQALSGAQLQAQQEQASVNSRVAQGQFGAQFGLSQEAQIAQSLAQQRQYNAGFGLNQSQQTAQQRIQQGQFNAQFGSQQDQWAAGFQAQQEMNQANMTQQQRAQNDAYQQMLLNQYMQSRGMQQQNAFHDQNAQLEAGRINAGISTGNQQAQMAAANSQMQQGTAILGMGATMGAAGLANGSFGGGGGGGYAPAPAVGNSGFNQSNPNKIDWGY